MAQMYTGCFPQSQPEFISRCSCRTIRYHVPRPIPRGWDIGTKTLMLFTSRTNKILLLDKVII